MDYAYLRRLIVMVVSVALVAVVAASLGTQAKRPAPSVDVYLSPVNTFTMTPGSQQIWFTVACDAGDRAIGTDYRMIDKSRDPGSRFLVQRNQRQPGRVNSWEMWLHNIGSNTLKFELRGVCLDLPPTR